MGLRLHVRGATDHKEYFFEDTVETIVFGRDPDRCQVLFPADLKVVGREHCALLRVLGRYRVVLNDDNLVRVDGKQAFEGEELPAECTLELGPGGPEILARRTGRADLEATVRQGHRPGQGTQLQQVLHASGRNRWLLVAVTGLLAVAVVLGLRAYRHTRSSVEDTSRSIEQQRARIAAVDRTVADMHEEITDVRDSLVSVGGDLGGLAESVGSMTKKFKDVEEKLAAKAPRIDAVLRTARPAVYLVLLASSDGKETGVGTAAVIGDGVLATNAHIADLFPDASQGSRMLVRSNAEQPETFRVREVVIHPGYAEFAKIWSKYSPVQGTNLMNADVIGPVSACDVALLRLEKPHAGLAAPLELADRASLHLLDGGDILGYVGYPMENMLLRGTPLRRPTPQLQIGAVTTTTSFFGAHGESEEARRDNQLVQHNCPATGGASGSPMLDQEGRVVAFLNAGNIAMLGPNRRISLGVGVNFAQRADLLRELLEGSAEEAQKGRRKRWKEAIHALFQSGHVLERATTVESVLSNVVSAIETDSGMQTTCTWKLVEERASRAGAPGTQDRRIRFDLPEAGPYVLLARAEERAAIHVTASFGTAAAGRSPLAPRELQPWMWLAPLPAAGPGELEVRATSDEEDLGVRYWVYRLFPEPLKPAVLRERLVSTWLLALAAQTGETWIPRQLASGTLRLDERGAIVTRMRIDGPGPCLAVAISPTFERLDMSVVRRNDGAVLGKDEGDDFYPACAFDVGESSDVEILLAGARPSAEAVIHLFQAHRE